MCIRDSLPCLLQSIPGVDELQRNQIILSHRRAFICLFYVPGVFFLPWLAYCVVLLLFSLIVCSLLGGGPVWRRPSLLLIVLLDQLIWKIIPSLRTHFVRRRPAYWPAQMYSFLCNDRGSFIKIKLVDFGVIWVTFYSRSLSEAPKIPKIRIKYVHEIKGFFYWLILPKLNNLIQLDPN